jgi:hypothetical protein
LDELLKEVNGSRTSIWLANQLKSIKAPAKRLLFSTKLVHRDHSAAFPVRPDTKGQFDLFAPDWLQLSLHDPSDDLGAFNRYFDVRLDNPFHQDASVVINGSHNVDDEFLQQVRESGSEVMPVLRIALCNEVDMIALLTDRMLQQIVAKQLVQFANVRLSRRLNSLLELTF